MILKPLNTPKASAFFDAYIKEKEAIDTAVVQAAKVSASKNSLKEAFSIAVFNRG